jgi:predicted nucleotidyltransferase
MNIQELKKQITPILEKNEAKRLAKEYSKVLKENNFSFEAVYLYGSYAQGGAKEWSDIDVAVVSNIFKRDREKYELLLWKLRRGLDSMIEPTGFTVEDFNENNSPLVYEIKEKGEKVA